MYIRACRSECVYVSAGVYVSVYARFHVCMRVCVCVCVCVRARENERDQKTEILILFISQRFNLM